MDTQNLISTNVFAKIVRIKSEDMLELTCNGISKRKYESDDDNMYAHKKDIKIYIPVEFLPYIMKGINGTMEDWGKSKIEFIRRIVRQFDTNIKFPE